MLSNFCCSLGFCFYHLEQARSAWNLTSVEFGKLLKRYNLVSNLLASKETLELEPSAVVRKELEGYLLSNGCKSFKGTHAVSMLPYPLDGASILKYELLFRMTMDAYGYTVDEAMSYLYMKDLFSCSR